MLGSLISGGLGLLGGLFSDNSQAKANAENIKYQKQFAQEGIQWRVADAEKAGVHPLYALGAQTTSFSPSVVGSSGVGTALASAGQDIGRAVAAKYSTDEFTKTTQALTLQRMGLENDLLASQIRKINAPGTPPMFNNRPVIAGEGDYAFVESPGGRLHAVYRPGLAADVQSHYGEGAGDLAGAEAYAVDLANQGNQARPGRGTHWYTGGGF